MKWILTAQQSRRRKAKNDRIWSEDNVDEVKEMCCPSNHLRKFWVISNEKIKYLPFIYVLSVYNRFDYTHTYILSRKFIVVGRFYAFHMTEPTRMPMMMMNKSRRQANIKFIFCISPTHWLL